MKKVIDFSTIIDTLLIDHEKNEVLLEYEKEYGLTRESLYDLQSHEWYTNYLNRLTYVPFEISNQLFFEFDLRLFQQLSAVTSHYKAYLKPWASGINHMYISIKKIKDGIAMDESVEINVQDLDSIQLQNVIRILVHDQMELSLQRLDEDTDLNDFDTMREESIAAWEEHVNKFYSQFFKIINISGHEQLIIT
ncbi:MAG: hypothetical protein ACQEQF_12845 [Bacillota bacterium]